MANVKPCSVCATTSRGKVERALVRGDSAAAVAVRYGLSRMMVDRHRRLHMASASPSSKRAAGESSKAKPPAVTVTPRPANATPLERARLNADEAHAALVRAESLGLPPADLARFRTALTSAEKHLARVTAEASVSMAEIVKSPAWRALVGEVGAALADYPDAAHAVVESLRRVEARGEP